MTIDGLIQSLGGADLNDSDLVPEGWLIKNAEKFNFGEFDDMPWFQSTADVAPYRESCPESFNLPHTNVLFFCNGSAFLHAFYTNDGMIHASLFFSDNKGITIMPTRAKIDYRQDQILAVRDEEFQYESEESVKTHLAWIYCALSTFLTILNCPNVKQIERVGNDSAIGKTAADKKNLPSFTYKEILIDPSKSPIRNVSIGGHSNRNAPRVHLRRGHLRRKKITA